MCVKWSVFQTTKAFEHLITALCLTKRYTAAGPQWIWAYDQDNPQEQTNKRRLTELATIKSNIKCSPVAEASELFLCRVNHKSLSLPRNCVPNIAVPVSLSVCHVVYNNKVCFVRPTDPGTKMWNFSLEDYQLLSMNSLVFLFSSMCCFCFSET